MKLERAGACPRCASELVRAGSHQPWCPSCEWNLDTFDPDVDPPLGWGWFERLSHRLAFRLDEREFARFRATLPSGTGPSLARGWLLGLSALLVAVGAGAVLAGCWLVIDGILLGFWWRVLLGILLICVGVLVRPRPGRLPKPEYRLRRERAPSLFALVERVAVRVGTPPPDFIVLNHEYNAGIGSYGWRGRTVLWLGAPLWLTLDPGMRVALLAHELGHAVNADPKRGRLVEPALNTFRRLAAGSDTGRSINQLLDPFQGSRTNIFTAISRIGLWAVSRLFLLIHLSVAAVAARDHQRAEYFADRVATEVAGTAATEALLDQSVVGEQVLASVRDNAHRVRPQHWSTLAAEIARATRPSRSEYRQLSRRSTSLWSSHPPSGLRAQLVQAWPDQPAGLVLTQAASDHIDRDLGFWLESSHRRLLGTRTFQQPAAEPGRP